MRTDSLIHLTESRGPILGLLVASGNMMLRFNVRHIVSAKLMITFLRRSGHEFRCKRAGSWRHSEQKSSQRKILLGKAALTSAMRRQGWKMPALSCPRCCSEHWERSGRARGRGLTVVRKWAHIAFGDRTRQGGGRAEKKPPVHCLEAAGVHWAGPLACLWAGRMWEEGGHACAAVRT